jgi:hypothetical protein
MGDIKKIGWLKATTAHRLVRASHLPNRITPVQQGSIGLIGTGISVVVGAYSVVAGGILMILTGFTGLTVPWMWNRMMRKYPALATVDVDAIESKEENFTIEFDPEDPKCVMVWPNQQRVVEGTLFEYTQRVFRVRVRNPSTTRTLEDVAVTLDRVIGMHARHPAVLHGYRLNVSNLDVTAVDIEPQQTQYFDVCAHEREDENAYPINDLFFRYAGITKGSVPTDPGVSFSLTLKAQPKGLVAVEGHFRVSIDEDTRASFQAASAPPSTGIEPTFGSGPPYEESNYHDASLDDGGNVYRIGLRSLDVGTSHVAKVEIESTSGAIEGGYANRPLRFKDSNAAEAHVAYGTGPTAFVEVLFSARFGHKRDLFLYAVKPQFGDAITTTGPFSIRLRITGAPNTTYMTIRFLRDFLGFPVPVGYDVE